MDRGAVDWIMAKYYKHKENAYIVGGVDWRKVLKISGLVILAAICLVRCIRLVEYHMDPRIRTETEFYNLLSETMEESGVKVMANGSSAELIFPDGTVAECAVFCDPDYYPDRISRIEVSYSTHDGDYAKNIVACLMQIFEPDFIENNGRRFCTYDDILAACRECDRLIDHYAFFDRATRSGHATHITLESTNVNDHISKNLIMELLFG